jgi:hypothetical protein
MHLSLDSCRIDDAPVLVETERIALADEAEFVFHLRAIPELRLKVVDAETKRELDGVEVFLGKGPFDVATLHPGTGQPRSDTGLRRLVETGKSPVAVPVPDRVDRDRSDKLWVRAPDHAWQSLTVLFAEGGTREVALSRAGALKVTVAGKLPAANTVLVRIYRAEQHEPLAEFGPGGGQFLEIEGLAPGTYELRLEHGEWFRNPRVLAQATVVVAVGATAQAELRSKAEVTAPARLALRGTVVIPEGWRVEPGAVGVQLDPLRGTDRWTSSRRLHGSELQRGAAAGEYRFAFGDVVAGRYTLVVTPSRHQQLVTVAEGRNENLRIEVPEPVEVVLRIVDSGTKAPRNGVMLHWNPQRPLGVMGGSLATAHAAADSNEIRFLAPVGRIEVMGHGEDYEIGHRTLTVAPDEHEFELEARPIYGVKVALYEGSTKVPTGFRSGWQLDLRSLDGESASTGRKGDDTLIVKAPGTYILRVVAPDGYAPVPDRQVKLAAGAFPTIEIRVARK